MVSFQNYSINYTAQGFILGTVLCATFVSPLADLAFLLTFADDNYIPRFNICVKDIIIDVENYLESIAKWLRDSGLSINKAKTEPCQFFKGDLRPISVDELHKTSSNTLCYVYMLQDSL
jgi:hypothetical protein